METGDSLFRTLARHAWILLVCMLLGALASAAVTSGTEPAYRASARVALGGWDPQDSVKAKVLADSARAIATSDRAVGGAIADAGVVRDFDDVAGKVSVTATGSSSVVDVAVEDADPTVAAKLANGIAEKVIDVRWNLIRGGIQSLVDDVDARSEALAERIGALEEAIQAAPVGSAQASLATQRYGSALRQRSDLADERRRLVSLGALQPQATVIDPATVPVAPLDDERTLAVILGIIAGLLAGLAIAATLELVRPTVTGSEAIARVAGGPWLSTLPVRPAVAEAEDVEAAAHAIRLAAASAGVAGIVIVPVGVDRDAATTLADRLRGHMGGAPEGASPSLGMVPGAAHVAVSSEATGGEGLIILAPHALRRRDLAPIQHLRAATGWPLIGVLLIRSTRIPRRLRAAKQGAVVPAPFRVDLDDRLAVHADIVANGEESIPSDGVVDGRRRATPRT